MEHGVLPSLPKLWWLPTWWGGQVLHSYHLHRIGSPQNMIMKVFWGPGCLSWHNNILDIMSHYDPWSPYTYEHHDGKQAFLESPVSIACWTVGWRGTVLGYRNGIVLDLVVVYLWLKIPGCSVELRYEYLCSKCAWRLYNTLISRHP